MKILWLSTKTPEPPIDGGRLLQSLTIDALRGAGAHVEVFAPEVNLRVLRSAAKQSVAGHAAPGGWRRMSKALRMPVTIARHDLPALRESVRDALAGGGFDVVHVEQLQALRQARSAAEDGVPVVLRAQNVESDLWMRASERLAPWSPFLRWEARRLQRYEGEAVSKVAATVALTRYDTVQLRRLAGELARKPARIVEIAAPFPAELPSGLRCEGDPALVLLGGADWFPNREGRRRFVEKLWPLIRDRLPGARLHLFSPDSAPLPPGPSSSGVVLHRLENSRDAFAEGAIQIVPLRVASGVRMKILEGWARGVPSVATPIAARGLMAEDGEHLLIGATPRELIDAVARLATDRELYGRLVSNGRKLLRERHDPANVAEQLTAEYDRAIQGVAAHS